MKNDSALFFACSLIEYIGREQKITRKDVVTSLGQQTLKRIYKYADVLHCEPIEKTANEYIAICNIPTGTYDNVKKCKYDIPDYWTIGEVYARLIEDVAKECVIETLEQIYTSWISDCISNYNSDFYYQSRDYIKQCYLEGKVI